MMLWTVLIGKFHLDHEQLYTQRGELILIHYLSMHC